MNKATRYKRMLLRQRRAGMWSIYQVKPDPYLFAYWLYGAQELHRILTDDVYAERVRVRSEAIRQLFEWPLSL